MQVQELRDGGQKTIRIPADIHRRLTILKRGNQTYGDVIAASLSALEREMSQPDIPDLDSIDMDALDKEVDEWEKEPDKYYITIAESEARYMKAHRIT